jgi:hypothetical protein
VVYRRAAVSLSAGPGFFKLLPLSELRKKQKKKQGIRAVKKGRKGGWKEGIAYIIVPPLRARTHAAPLRSAAARMAAQKNARVVCP